MRTLPVVTFTFVSLLVYLIVWTEETLDEWFKDPGKIAPQSVMITNGKVEDPALRRKLISFLMTEDPTVNTCPQ